MFNKLLDLLYLGDYCCLWDKYCNWKLDKIEREERPAIDEWQEYRIFELEAEIQDAPYWSKKLEEVEELMYYAGLLDEWEDCEGSEAISLVHEMEYRLGICITSTKSS